jgi:hypothetical protein
MGQQKGLVKLEGKIGDLSFYRSGGKDLVRLPGGADKAKIMSDPKFARVRENMSEFAGCAKVVKAFRDGAAGVMSVFQGRYMTSKLMSVLKEVCNNGAGKRGQRDFEIVNNALLFEGFNFNPKKVIGTIFSAPFTFSANVGRNVTTLKVPDFNTANYINAPMGATHFCFVNNASILSDYAYNVTTGKYVAVNPTIDGLNVAAVSAYIPLGGMVGGVTTLVATIAGAPVMVPTAGLMGCVGIEFFQLVNTVYYLLNAENGMNIAGVF